MQYLGVKSIINSIKNKFLIDQCLDHYYESKCEYISFLENGVNNVQKIL